MMTSTSVRREIGTQAFPPGEWQVDAAVTCCDWPLGPQFQVGVLVGKGSNTLGEEAEVKNASTMCRTAGSL